jgi:uncharacterized membrane protein YphA (DoxX/SURF4 family)
MVTDRARTLLPTQDISMFVYVLGAIELIIAVLLLSGVVVRATAIAATVMLVTIIATAQYPSSFPQDIGLIGIAVMLVITSAGWRSRIEQTTPSLIVRYSISAVLLIWAVDHLVNASTHVSWMQLINTTMRTLPSESIHQMIFSIAIIEIIIGVMLASGKLARYFSIAASALFIVAYISLAPPLNSYQSIGLAITSAWLFFIAVQDRGKISH